MDVILKQDVKNLGKKESMVKVNDGYARNYLIPRGLAVEATSANVNIMKTKKKAEENKKERELAHAKELAEKLNKTTVIFKTKAGDNGKLFGSITSKDISEKLKTNHKLDIDKRKINLSDAIKTIGTSEVEVKVYAGVTAKMTVKVESE